MVKISLIHVHSFHNAGDAVLTKAAISNLSQNFPNAQITVVVNDPSSYEGPELLAPSFLAYIQQTPHHQLWRFLRLLLVGGTAILSQRLFGRARYITNCEAITRPLRAILEADLVVGTPGGYFYSYGRGRALLILILAHQFALWAGKPVYLLPQSYGPFRSRLERWLMQNMLKKVRLVMAREKLSLEHLRACGFPTEDMIVLPDMALGFDIGSVEEGTKVLSQAGISSDESCIGVTIINWQEQYKNFKQQEQYESALAAALKDFSAHHPQVRIIFFPQCTGPTDKEDDRIPARRVAERCRDAKQPPVVLDKPLSAEALAGAIGQMEIFIGTRMHSNIFALHQYIPLLPIGYLHKTQGIADMIGLSQWVIDIKNIDSAALSRALEKLWVERSDIKHHLMNVLPAVFEDARLPGQMIGADYQRFLSEAK